MSFRAMLRMLWAIFFPFGMGSVFSAMLLGHLSFGYLKSLRVRP